MNLDDHSGSAFTGNAFTMAAWLITATSRFLSRKSAHATRRVSVCLRSGSSRLIRKIASLSQGRARTHLDGRRKSFLNLSPINRSLLPSWMPSCNCLATIWLYSSRTDPLAFSGLADLCSPKAQIKTQVVKHSRTHPRTPNLFKNRCVWSMALTLAPVLFYLQNLR